ncbi:MAG: hypothetical protein PVF77_10005, partial [Anaerolineae bacterium]
MKDESGERGDPSTALRTGAGVRVEVQVAPDFVGLVREHRMRAVAEAALRTEGRDGELALVITGDRGI